jgi:pectate lyase
VTHLDTDSSDMTPGGLRYGLSTATGPRTIVFDISGVFLLGRSAVSGWDSNGNGWDTASRLNLPADVTVAGQTAPGPVVIAGGSVRPGETNIILRNVTIAPGYGNRNFDEPGSPPVQGDFPDSYVYDALDISGQRVIVDHVTTLFATDETISMNEQADDVTIQYSIIAQAQNYPQADAESSGVRYTGHALGSLLQAGSDAAIGVHHNLHAHL